MYVCSVCVFFLSLKDSCLAYGTATAPLDIKLPILHEIINKTDGGRENLPSGANGVSACCFTQHRASKSKIGKNKYLRKVRPDVFR